MKLTKSRLRQLIKEEMDAIRLEQEGPMAVDTKELMRLVCEKKDVVYAALSIPYVQEQARDHFLNYLTEKLGIPRGAVETITQIIEEKVGSSIEELLANEALKAKLKSLIDFACMLL